MTIASLATLTPEEAIQLVGITIAEIVARETLDDAVIAYKYAAMAEKASKEQKDAIRALVAKMMESEGLAKHKTPFATVGWTEPNPDPEPKLNEKALLIAAERDPALMAAIKPYLEWPEPRQKSLYIK